MTAASSGRIFISYRRQETAWPARQLYEVLAERFRPEQVFKDVDNIEPGDDFVDKITEAVASCDVLLALIGTQWVTMADATGARRLDDPDDFVRLEIRAALSRGVRVIPILVDGARMPQAADLPDDLVPITRRQAVEINPVTFDTERLMATLTDTLSPRPPTAVAGPGPVEEMPAPDAPAAADVIASSDLPGLTPQSAPDPEAIEVPEPEAPAPLNVAPSPPVPPLDAGSHTRAPLTPPPAPPATRRRGLVVLGATVGVLAVLGAGYLVFRPHPATVTSTAPWTPSASASAPSPSLSPSANTSPTTSSGASTFPLIVAHRGGLEHHQFETQQSLEQAALDGYGVETDVRYTSDGVAVLVHDEQATQGLDCGGRSLRVSQTTWATLKKVCRSKPIAVDRRSYPVPRLDATLEGIAAANSQAWIFAEIKVDLNSAGRRSFLAEFTGKGLRDRTVIGSFELDRLVSIRSTDASFKRILYVQKNRVPVSSVSGQKLWGVAVEFSIASADYIAQLKKAGLKVMVWNLNDPAAWEAAVKLKADMVMTDYPDKYAQWLKDR